MSRTFLKRHSFLLIVLLLVSFITGCGSSNTNIQPKQSPDVEPVVLKLGHTNSPGQPCANAVETMAETVKEKTDGKVVFEIYVNGAIGDEEELVESCMMGTVDMAFVSGASLGGLVPEYLVIDLPFPFSTPEEAYEFYDGEVGDILLEKAEAQGLIGLSWLENGFRNMTNNVRTIKTPYDMKGLKMRTMSSPVFVNMMNALGASATPIPFGELYTALEQGTVDGQENPVTNIYSAKFYEVQKYITLTRHSYDPNILFMSEKSLEKLTEEQFDIIKEAALTASKDSRAANNAGEEETLSLFEENGLEVYRISNEEHQLFVDATKDVYKEFVDVVGAEFMDKYQKAIGR
jgi:tripartite ATP-independent transporter DctP family solute receptor